jgi:1,4-dihydroxy-2-naphthoate octaprenyltransferase
METGRLVVMSENSGPHSRRKQPSPPTRRPEGTRPLRGRGAVAGGSSVFVPSPVRGRGWREAPGEGVPSRTRIWVQAVRIFSFTASTIPIAVAGALALYDRTFDWLLFLLMLFASVACHAGANLANDYYDHIKGVDTDDSLGPSKVIQQGLLSPAEVKRGAIVAFAIATALGLIIVSQSSWVILALALASLAAAVLYTGGPIPLGYIALGEVTVFIFMGPVMIGGVYYVMAERLTLEAILASIPIGLLVAVILHANNIRDIELDQRAGKVTLATIVGKRWAGIEYVVLVAGAYIATLALILAESGLWPMQLVALTMPAAFRLCRIALHATDVLQLNVLLRRTAGLHLRFGAFMTVGLVVAAILERVW